MPAYCDGPVSPLFAPVKFAGGTPFEALPGLPISSQMKDSLRFAPSGHCVCWGMPFAIGHRIAVAVDKPVTLKLGAVKTPWLVFMHTTDAVELPRRKDGVYSPAKGYGLLGETAADYVVIYADGTEVRRPVLRRHEINLFQRPWGESSFACVAHIKPYTLYPMTQQPRQEIPFDPEKNFAWGTTQTRSANVDLLPWTNWLWAWENPHPRKTLTGLRIEPCGGAVLVFAITAGKTDSLPYRWETRRKAVLHLPKGVKFDPTLHMPGLLDQIQLDLGQVISAEPRRVYPNDTWAKTPNNAVPESSEREVLIEYTAHPEARFHLRDGRRVPVGKLNKPSGPLEPVAPATQRVTLRVVDKASKKPVAVKLHVHGEAGEYLAPMDRHRYPNPAWYEDYSTDFVHRGLHNCTYIDGEAVLDVPLGRIFVEVSKGYEVRPVRKTFRITPSTRTITVTLEKVLPWRERGWVTADTHVHFVSPTTGLLESAAEGVNVVNLLASQWGELFTNIGDFDGKTVHGSKEAGGDGEYLLRVGTENRQHVLGHISLLGYGGRPILPLTTGGPDESALGDPVEVAMSEWARQCREQGGVVVLPHFAQPRAEGASCIVQGDIDAVEMTSWGNLYGGIDPYSLSDWYRYLNCGYFVAAVGGTDKMSADTPIGAVRTYAQIAPGRPFSYETWKEAVRAGHTFVTYGPLLEFSVEGRAPGSRLAMKRSGGRVTVEWHIASVTIPMTRADLVVNGEIRESRAVKPSSDSGYWTLELDRSSWAALLVRGHYPGKPEIIAAHSSPVMISVEGTEFLAAADAVTILEQIEGSLAYLDGLAVCKGAASYKRMRLVLTAAHRALHNRLHQAGHFHRHLPPLSHGAHHRSN